MSDKYENRYELKPGLNDVLYIIDNKEKTNISISELIRRTNDYFNDSRILENKIIALETQIYLSSPDGIISLLRQDKRAIDQLTIACKSNNIDAIYEKKVAKYMGYDFYFKLEIKGR